MRTTSWTNNSSTAAACTTTTAQRRHLEDQQNHSVGESNKRIRQHEGNDVGADDSMDVDMTPIKPPPPAAASSNNTNPDDILVAMVQSGNHTHDEVVQFCLQSGIPLSRMLRLDLMRLSQKNNKDDDGRAPPNG